MAETMKAKIARLEAELEEERHLNELIKSDNLRLAAELSAYLDSQAVQDKESITVKQLREENEMLRSQLLRIGRIQEIGKSMQPAAIRNARGAGRKAKFTASEVEEVLKMRDAGMSMARIAEKKMCSVGLIHKLIHENK